MSRTLAPATVLSPEVLALMSWQQVSGVGYQRLQRLAAHPALALALWQGVPNQVQARLGLSDKALAQWQQLRHDTTLWERLQAPFEHDPLLSVLRLGDPLYPPALASIYKPPPWLYCRGDATCLTAHPWLAVVGTRKASPFGQELTHQLVEGLAGQPLGIISGLAAGIDTYAHRAALTAELPTVAVFGCGLDVIYPANNRGLAERIVASGGCLLSEYAFGTPGHASQFPQRNRIVAGLSQAVLLVEAPEKSGATITTRLALEEGRDVLAVPGDPRNVNSQGPLRLIQQGAMAVWQPEHIVQALASPAEQRQALPAATAGLPLFEAVKPAVQSVTSAPPPPASAESSPADPQTEAVLTALPLGESRLLDELAGLTGLPLPVLQGVATQLELCGQVRRDAGARLHRLR